MSGWVCVYFDLRFARLPLPRPLAAAATFFGGSGAAAAGDEVLSSSTSSSSSDMMAESWFRTFGGLDKKEKSC